MKRNRNRKGSLRQHSLSLMASAVVVLLIVLYRRSDPDTRIGALFGNAIRNWSFDNDQVFGSVMLIGMAAGGVRR